MTSARLVDQAEVKMIQPSLNASIEDSVTNSQIIIYTTHKEKS